MKMKYLFHGLLASILLITACQEPDDLVRSDSENINILSVKGSLISDADKQYDAIVDEANGTITVQVPYYISDTEKIQGDLTQMKVTANMPTGARFEPEISGIHDLVAGFQSTLIKEDGTKTLYTFKAIYAKSKSALITKIVLPDIPNPLITIKSPENEGENGIIVIYKTSSSIDAAIRSAQLFTSPWATIESTAMDSEGYIDLSQMADIYVIAQDGVTKQKYTVEIQTPSFVAPGRIGYKSLLFGFQTTPADPRGFVPTNNRSLAIVNNYLIVSSTTLDFVVLNRYSGEHLKDIQVNTTGLPTGLIHAITQDDANHMVAITFCAANNPWSKNQLFEIYVWKNGITNPPTKIMSEDILTSDVFAQFRSTNASVATTGTWDMGRTVSIKGDITNGTAILMSLANSVMNRVLRVKTEDGKVISVHGSAKGLYSWYLQSKPIPMTTEDECDYIMSSNNARKNVIYTPKEGSQIIFDPNGNWWGGSLIGTAYTEFNGVKLVAVQNSNTTSKPQYCRLCIGNITSMTTTAMADAQIMDSRLDNYDPAFGPTGPNGNNSSLTGMTSFYNAIGENPNSTGDIAIGHSADGNSIQVYMLTTDHGIIAYELTKYNL